MTICQVLDIALERTRREGRTPQTIKLGWQEYGRLRRALLADIAAERPVRLGELDGQIATYQGYRVAMAGQPSLVKVE